MNDWKLKSDSQSKLVWLGTEGALLEEHDYLFRTKKGEEPFIEIQISLHELNDFCVTLFNSIANTAVDESVRYDELIESTKDEDGYYDSDRYDDLFALSMLSYKCEDFGKIFTPASAVLLLYATLIRSLHSIARYYGSVKYKQWQSAKDPRGAEIPPIRELLESICNRKIDVFDHPQVKALITERARFLRNKFIHGEWHAVEKGLVGVNIRMCFELVSYIFSELELLFDEPKGIKLA
mgnify:CR=1 FL=1